jgi:hypothetical protein
MVLGTSVPTYAGRPAGVKNKNTRMLEAKALSAQERARMILGEEEIEAFKGDAHVWLCVLYMDPRQPIEVRLEAAKAALPYEKPKLAAIAVKTDKEVTLSDLIMETVIKAKQIEGLVIENDA